MSVPVIEFARFPFMSDEDWRLYQKTEINVYAIHEDFANRPIQILVDQTQRFIRLSNVLLKDGVDLEFVHHITALLMAEISLRGDYDIVIRPTPVITDDPQR